MQLNFFRFVVKLLCTLVFSLACPLLSSQGQVFAQDDPFDYRAPSCSNGTASGTYGYRMSGVIVGVGPILVNGIFTNTPEGNISGNVHVTIAGQQIPNASWSTGTFKTNNDCTGSGKFFVAALNQEITFNFIATDGGRQIELLNTNAGNAFHGYGRRISAAGRAPSCNNGSVLGTYGYRLDGSIPGVPNLIAAGTVTHRLGDNFSGVFSGSDALSINGMQVPTRTYQGAYQVSSDCTGKGNYSDSLGNTVEYTFVVIDGGKEIYFQATKPGDSISGVGRRVE